MLSRLPSLLVVIALAVAGLIPTGWMPGNTNDGKVLLVICTGTGPVETWVDLDGDTPDHAPTEQMEDRSCPFAAIGALALLPDNQITVELGAALSDRWARAAFTHHSAGFHWRYDARGPPALS